MISESKRTLLRKNGTMLGRTFLGLLFLISGVQTFMNIGVDGFTNIISDIGIPAAGLVAVLVLLIKIVGGAGLILGYKTDESAGLLFIFTFLTILFVHNTMEDAVSALKNLSIMGGLLYVLAYGPGEGWKLKTQ